MEKIKAFFQNKWTKRVFWGTWTVSSVGLVIGGVTAETLNSGVALVLGGVQGLLLLGAFIFKQINK